MGFVYRSSQFKGREKGGRSKGINIRVQDHKGNETKNAPAIFGITDFLRKYSLTEVTGVHNFPLFRVFPPS